MTQNIDIVETLQGSIERVTYQNADNGFCVLRVKVSGRKDLVTVVGNAQAVSAGEYIQSSGVWFHDKNYGLQFKSQFIKVTPPTSLEGIERYLGSGMIKGIGRKFAGRLVEYFGKRIFDIIENEPEQLLSVEGIGQHRVRMIIESWEEQRVVRDIMMFLHDHGVSQSRAVRIYKTYGMNAIQKITENPYCLARDIQGIGFLSADKIAQNIGIERQSMTRAKAGIRYALFESMQQGHCGFPIADLIPLCHDLLDIDKGIIQDALTSEIEEKEVIIQNIQETDCVFLSGLFYSEKAIADKLMLLQTESLPWSNVQADVAISWVEKKNQIQLSKSQKAAIKMALSSKVLVITGGPGVGKTTLVRSILNILESKKIKILLTAPTGRAAKRLSESTGLEAKTIHRLLQTNPKAGGFSKNADNPLDCDLLIVDESSMVDVPLMHALLKATPKESAIFFVGDIDQLPSVGPGKVLSDLIESNMIPTVRLTEIFRQASGSKIIQSAHKMNLGHMPDLTHDKDTMNDFYFIEAQTQEEALEKIIFYLTDRIPSRFGYDAIKDIQVLCPMGRGIVGTKNLNVELQKKLNPPSDNSITRFGSTYSVDDKVMQIQNNYDKDVFNGDIGIIQSLSNDDDQLIIRFDDRDVLYDFNELDEITLSYATTIHKSQGSEYPVVILPIMMTHYIMLKRNLLYTGFTRGKKLVLIVGEKKALSLCVKQKDTNKRWTSLLLRLQEYSHDSMQLIA